MEDVKPDQTSLFRNDQIDMDGEVPALPPTLRNDDKSIRQLRAFNLYYRRNPWPAPFDQTHQTVVRGDARRLPFADESAGLVLTHPPYFDIKSYETDAEGNQLGHWKDYDEFLEALDDVWREAYRVLEPGGRVCCVIGDALQTSRGANGRHSLLPIPHDIMSRARHLDFDVLTPILWGKVANKGAGAKRRNAGFLGPPYQPNCIINSKIEYIVMLRKPGKRNVSMTARGLSALTPEEVDRWQRAEWNDIPGADLSGRHPAPFPERVAHRLIRLFSFAGDWVIDPFMGSGTTAVMAQETGRNAAGVDVEDTYVDLARRRIKAEGRLVA